MPKLLRKLGIGLAWRFALPAAWLWVWRHQRKILRHGRALNDGERAIAKQLGIECCEKVRIWSVERVPSPGGVLLQGLSRLAGTNTHGAKGMALDHGIYLEAAQAERRSLLAHELAHVAQYERLGGKWAFLRRYLNECLRDGYWSAPMEIEARQCAAEIGESRPE
jgi:hypothetical protein